MPFVRRVRFLIEVIQGPPRPRSISADDEILVVTTDSDRLRRIRLQLDAVRAGRRSGSDGLQSAPEITIVVPGKLGHDVRGMPQANFRLINANGGHVHPA